MDKYKDAPEWFRNYVVKCRKDKVELNKNIKNLSDRFESIESMYGEHFKCHDAEIAKLKSDLKKLVSESQSLGSCKLHDTNLSADNTVSDSK